MNEDKKYIVKGSLINSLGVLTNAISPLLVLLLARFFPQEEFGLFISLQLFVLTASRFFVLGLDKGLMWFIPQNQRHSRPEGTGIFPALNISLISACIGFGIGALAIKLGVLTSLPELSRLPQSVILLCIFNVIPYMLLNIGATSFEGIRKPQYKILINRFVVNSLFPVFAIICYYASCGIYSLAIGFTIANCLGAFWYCIILQKRFQSWSFSLAIPKELLQYSLPLTLSDFISSILLRVDIWMVLALLGPEKSAIYSIMVVLSNGVKTIRQNFDSLVVTVVSKMNRKDISIELKPVFSYTINIVTLIQLFIALAILFLPKEILMVAGKNYSHSPQALSILLIGNLINGVLGANGLVLLGIGKSKLALYINAISLTVNIVGNLILIPSYGIFGAATASVIAILVQNSLCFISLFIITKKHYYEKHLIINIVLIMLFSYTVFTQFTAIQLLDFGDRIAYFGLATLICGSIVYLKKASLKLS